MEEVKQILFPISDSESNFPFISFQLNRVRFTNPDEAKTQSYSFFNNE